MIMKKSIIFIILNLFFMNTSFAEWILGSTTKTDTYYYEDSTIVKDGDITYIWILVDKKEVGEAGEMSTKAYLPIKCKLNQFQLVQMIYYPKKMGSGNLIERVDNPDIKWIAAAPGSAWAGLIKRVCGR